MPVCPAHGFRVKLRCLWQDLAAVYTLPRRFPSCVAGATALAAVANDEPRPRAGTHVLSTHCAAKAAAAHGRGRRLPLPNGISACALRKLAAWSDCAALWAGGGGGRTSLVARGRSRLPTCNRQRCPIAHRLSRPLPRYRNTSPMPISSPPKRTGTASWSSCSTSKRCRAMPAARLPRSSPRRRMRRRSWTWTTSRWLPSTQRKQEAACHRGRRTCPHRLPRGAQRAPRLLPWLPPPLLNLPRFPERARCDPACAAPVAPRQARRPLPLQPRAWSSCLPSPSSTCQQSTAKRSGACGCVRWAAAAMLSRTGLFRAAGPPRRDLAYLRVSLDLRMDPTVEHLLHHAERIVRTKASRLEEPLGTRMPSLAYLHIWVCRPPLHQTQLFPARRRT